MLQRWELINARLGRPPRDGKTCAPNERDRFEEMKRRGETQ
jgi:hypothetical protein